ncbi:RNA-binding protein [Myxococcus sp. AM009]|uniref:RNA-binding protein n=1 Tax=unclassified Myxococcus TaxID=2648731 RepID=UPI0015963923|nr:MULTISPECIES: RNA-binding protein [unclassified Myxococcus]NVI98968.1 RNA-binding protein [Myxococcus sp. AM009]NVJ16125.1 RNA-binding protein [Myxococcus sp. AM010]
MKKLVGVFATIAMLGSGTALANNDENKPKDSSAAQGGSGQVGETEIQKDTTTTIERETTATPAEPGMGGSGTMGQQANMGQKELNGRVVKAESDKIFVDMQGAVVPLEVDRSTTFSDPTLKKAKDLRPGQEIRASYQVKETKNVAKSISLSGTGGAGDPALTPDSSINQDSDMGGSGVEQHEGTGGAGDDSTLNPDTGSNTSPDTY